MKKNKEQEIAALAGIDSEDKEQDKAEASQANADGSDKDTEPEETTEASDPSASKKRKRRRKKQPPKRKPEEVNIVKELLSLIVYIGFVILICYLIITFVGCRSKVDGSSMNPTLDDGDNLWVSKISYTLGDPKRFDVIIFNYDENTTYVKRIIGLPGETVRIDEKGDIYINEKPIIDNYGKEKIYENNRGRASQPVKLGEDEYFVLGDNRNGSTDSRWASVGNVSREDIVGKAIFRIYPFSGFGRVR